MGSGHQPGVCMFYGSFSKALFFWLSSLIWSWGWGKPRFFLGGGMDDRSPIEMGGLYATSRFPKVFAEKLKKDSSCPK